jgi:hypothetical protein
MRIVAARLAALAAAALIAAALTVGLTGGTASASASFTSAGRVYGTHMYVRRVWAQRQSLYTLERARGFAPQQAANRAREMKYRVYPGSWWTINTRLTGWVFIYS